MLRLAASPFSPAFRRWAPPVREGEPAVVPALCGCSACSAGCSAQAALSRAWTGAVGEGQLWAVGAAAARALRVALEPPPVSLAAAARLPEPAVGRVVELVHGVAALAAATQPPTKLPDELFGLVLALAHRKKTEGAPGGQSPLFVATIAALTMLSAHPAKIQEGAVGDVGGCLLRCVESALDEAESGEAADLERLRQAFEVYREFLLAVTGEAEAWDQALWQHETGPEPCRVLATAFVALARAGLVDAPVGASLLVLLARSNTHVPTRNRLPPDVAAALSSVLVELPPCCVLQQSLLYLAGVAEWTPGRRAGRLRARRQRSEPTSTESAPHEWLAGLDAHIGALGRWDAGALEAPLDASAVARVAGLPHAVVAAFPRVAWWYARAVPQVELAAAGMAGAGAAGQAWVERLSSTPADLGSVVCSGTDDRLVRFLAANKVNLHWQHRRSGKLSGKAWCLGCLAEPATAGVFPSARSATAVPVVCSLTISG
eukprot:TRINITY_DN2226_c0_g1_i1.p1 TRINITY_DN2226_c0_g1~~TRINITY_DN2226_c0_g1_i1.p1  ORF type:complete len:489 (+),score=110.00 TRINITY_DN2226_c0_g1_i1:802-2268(+)